MKKAILVLLLFVRITLAEQIVGFSFDIDDNLLELPTQIMLFDKKTGKERGVSTDQYALIREHVGKPGTEWENYELRDNWKTGSLRYFGDQIGDGVNYFLKSLQEAMKASPNGWKGPVFDALVIAMSNATSAAQTSFISARGHEPETILEGFRYLQSKGLIKHLPAKENVWMVSGPSFETQFRGTFHQEPPAGSAAQPSARKAAVMEQILDKINATPLKKGQNHLWGFSDDDFGNYEKAMKVIQAGINAGRWPRVNVSLFFTGTNNPKEKPRTVVLVKNGPPRPMTAAEDKKWRKLIRPDVVRPTRHAGNVSQPVEDCKEYARSLVPAS